jgi:hypothetical protein
VLYYTLRLSGREREEKIKIERERERMAKAYIRLQYFILRSTPNKY